MQREHPLHRFGAMITSPRSGLLTTSSKLLGQYYINIIISVTGAITSKLLIQIYIAGRFLYGFVLAFLQRFLKLAVEQLRLNFHVL